jgi:hypothetical protein
MDGWYYSSKYDHWQKVNDCVYAYVTPMAWGYYKAQLYMRATTALCSLEVRTENDVQKMFSLAEEWLTKYADGNMEKIVKDKYSIDNPNGVWGKNFYHLKQYWI